jgi:hypothetical protein
MCNRNMSFVNGRRPGTMMVNEREGSVQEKNCDKLNKEPQYSNNRREEWHSKSTGTNKTRERKVLCNGPLVLIRTNVHCAQMNADEWLLSIPLPSSSSSSSLSGQERLTSMKRITLSTSPPPPGGCEGRDVLIGMLCIHNTAFPGGGESIKQMFKRFLYELFRTNVVAAT